MKHINIGLLGLGTVGRGVYQLLTRENDVLKQRLGAKITIKKILVKDPTKERGILIPAGLLTTNAQEILNDTTIDIIIEVIGGTGEAKNLVLEALKKGKPVVTANKELMANYGQQVLQLAAEKNVEIGFEASVGAGIPIIRALKESLTGNCITRLMGIINGTTNFILSQMSQGKSYQQALAQAQALGYAESNPTADVSGRDAAAKIAILASIAFNSRVTGNQVYTEGITNIKPQDLAYAKELGFAVKLVALAKRENNEIDVRVHPTLIPLKHPLAAVNDVYNAIFVEGDAVGELMFFGQGAGSLPTASAIVSDVFQIARNLPEKQATAKLNCTCFYQLKVKPIEEVETAYYLLIKAHDKPGVLAKIAQAFGDNMVSLSSVIQKQTDGKIAEVVFMTHQVAEGNLRKALKAISQLEVVDKISNVMRVENAHG